MSLKNFYLRSPQIIFNVKTVRHISIFDWVLWTTTTIIVLICTCYTSNIFGVQYLLKCKYICVCMRIYLLRIFRAFVNSSKLNEKCKRKMMKNASKSKKKMYRCLSVYICMCTCLLYDSSAPYVIQRGKYRKNNNKYHASAVVYIQL